MIRAVLALIARDLRLAGRVGGSGALSLVFFLMIVALVPFALGPDLNLLSRIGPAILWLAAVLSTLIGLDRLFQADEEDGSLDLMTAAPVPLELVVLAKVTAHWLTTGLPLALAAPLFGLLVALDGTAMSASALTLLAGTPALSFIGAVGAALTASIRRGGLILAVLVLPLMIPTLIFGVSAAQAASGDGAVPRAAGRARSTDVDRCRGRNAGGGGGAALAGIAEALLRNAASTHRCASSAGFFVPMSSVGPVECCPGPRLWPKPATGFGSGRVDARRPSL